LKPILVLLQIILLYITLATAYTIAWNAFVWLFSFF